MSALPYLNGRLLALHGQRQIGTHRTGVGVPLHAQRTAGGLLANDTQRAGKGRRRKCRRLIGSKLHFRHIEWIQTGLN